MKRFNKDGKEVEKPVANFAWGDIDKQKEWTDATNFWLRNCLTPQQMAEKIKELESKLEDKYEELFNKVAELKDSQQENERLKEGINKIDTMSLNSEIMGTFDYHDLSLRELLEQLLETKQKQEG